MFRFLIGRLLQGLLVLFALYTITFFLAKAMPGEPFTSEKNVSAETKANIRKLYGLDKSLLEQYYVYPKNIITEGSFGISTSKGRPVRDIIWQSFPNSLLLGLCALCFAVGIGVPIGVLSAVRRNSWVDWTCMAVAMVGICVPSFTIGPLLQIYVATHVPGLKVVMPSTAEDAKGLLLSSIFDPDPVIFLEHRWLHNLKGDVPDGDYRVPLGEAHLVRQGKDITVVAMSYMTIEALHAVDHLAEQGVTCDLIDLRSVLPLDWAAIESSVRRTGRLLVLDTGTLTGSISGEIVARIASTCWEQLKCAPHRLAMPDVPEPTSFGLTKDFHITAKNVVEKVLEMFKIQPEDNLKLLNRDENHDVPGDWFTGPF